MALMNRLRCVAPRLLSRGHRRLEHGVSDVATARLECFAERTEIDVFAERRQDRVDLDAPDLLALLDPGHLEQDVRADPPLERRIEVRGQVGREDDDAREAL